MEAAARPREKSNRNRNREQNPEAYYSREPDPKNGRGKLSENAISTKNHARIFEGHAKGGNRNSELRTDYWLLKQNNNQGREQEK
jgi:hypothetical protein